MTSTLTLIDRTDTQRGMLLGLSQKRHLRSKIWWFTEFCNSHYVSHFAAFFIVTRTKISIAKSCSALRISYHEPTWRNSEESNKRLHEHGSVISMLLKGLKMGLNRFDRTLAQSQPEEPKLSKPWKGILSGGRASLHTGLDTRGALDRAIVVRDTKCLLSEIRT